MSAVHRGRNRGVPTRKVDAEGETKQRCWWKRGERVQKLGWKSSNRRNISTPKTLVSQIDEHTHLFVHFQNNKKGTVLIACLFLHLLFCLLRGISSFSFVGHACLFGHGLGARGMDAVAPRKRGLALRGGRQVGRREEGNQQTREGGDEHQSHRRV